MTDKDVRAAMNKLDTAAPSDALPPQRAASRVIERHHRQMRLLMGTSIVLWFVAAAGVLYVVYGALWHFYPRQKMLFREAALGKLTAEQIDALQATHYIVIEAATIILAASFLALALATLCTVVLVVVSRRATLAQINRHLAEISEQLRPPPNGPPS
jgi:hypothetical protein